MNRIVNATFFAVIAACVSAAPASAQSLRQLGSACNAGDSTACSAYNQLLINSHAGTQPALTQGYDPFGMVPASHVQREPIAATAGDEAAGKAAPEVAVITQ